MRLLLPILLAVLMLIQYRLWFGHNSVRDYLNLGEQLVKAAELNDEMVQRNQLLREEITDLNRGGAAIEEYARNELGMIEPGETFFRIIDDSSDPTVDEKTP